jgi:hypothetical protein
MRSLKNSVRCKMVSWKARPGARKMRTFEPQKKSALTPQDDVAQCSLQEALTAQEEKEKEAPQLTEVS